jgi:hypothetical protein
MCDKTACCICSHSWQSEPRVLVWEQTNRRQWADSGDQSSHSLCCLTWTIWDMIYLLFVFSCPYFVGVWVELGSRINFKSPIRDRMSYTRVSYEEKLILHLHSGEVIVKSKIKRNHFDYSQYWRSYRHINDNLGCCTMQYFGCVPMFQRNILPPSYELKWGVYLPTNQKAK